MSNPIRLYYFTAGLVFEHRNNFHMYFMSKLLPIVVVIDMI